MIKRKFHFMGLLANVDESILKMDFGQGFEIKQMSFDKAGDFLTNFESKKKNEIMDDLYMKYQCVVGDQVFYVYKESYYNVGRSSDGWAKLSKPVANHLEPRLQLMRLFKEGNLYLLKRYYYRLIEGVPGLSLAVGPYPNIESEKYELTDEDIPDLMRFIENTKIPFGLDYLNSAFKNFEQSYIIQNRDLAFVSLMMGMEVLFNPEDKKGGLTKKMARYTANLISSSKEKPDIIQKRMIYLYEKRCQIVHEGKTNVVQPKDMSELRDYLRRSIKEAHKIGEEKEDLLTMLDTVG
jgi:hypothetical protein